MKKVLIANRGEIAVRIIRASREMGIQTVAVYSDADRSALHVRLADEAIRIGSSPPGESYLNINAILDAAKQTHADAIHPGYGFLAENAEFAQAVNAAGILFIGPSPFSIRAMGDKAEARARMMQSGVPIVPGYQESNDDALLERAAKKIGYPVLIKAAAGGGGKAMRVVEHSREFHDALGAARREAQHAFSDDRVILEKYVANARHIEFQILADKHGNTLHLFERECSIQRRYQKIIEETPSPLLDQKLRAKMGAAAVAAARAVNYENAGTIEFIVDPETRAFYFLEMNTRLQVEHPITEMTTGFDLVQWQLRIAQDERLPFQQEELQARGHAIECRIYAEDPANGFLPATGRALEFELPNIPGVRADTGIARVDEITAFYDPLLVKLIAYAETRQNAIQRMQDALRGVVLLGITTNLDFLQAVLAHPIFRKGQATTRFIEENFAAWKPITEIPQEVWIAAALLDLQQSASASVLPTAANDPYSPWQSANAFRIGAK
ncbi:MAG TPA: acetyl-CoA carboxylase biotin carboxylase subunit [Anaerolineae bacterium]|nr:acetyl-CoA carboxylase biotin carboxylase subunit [Anaerolineae bacterium]